MEPAIGHQLRARRTGEGRTVASVASDAGLSVPYIANLENGRGNPTVTALARLAGALGTRLEINLVHPGDGDAGARGRPSVPASLVRLGRTRRFRSLTGELASALGLEAGELAARLVDALAGLADALGVEPAEADWWRVLDALTLVVSRPARVDGR